MLRRVFLAIAIALSAAEANASEPSQPWNWSGAYLGPHAGGMLGFSSVSDPYGRSIYGDTVRTPGVMLGGQAGYNWQAAGSPFVYGIEGEVSLLDANGTATCFAFSGTFHSSNCRARPDFTAALNGRFGYAGGPGGRTLYYLKGGAAVLHNRIDATTNYGFGVFPVTRAGTTETSLGWTIGAGIEHAIGPAWSVKLEYDYRDFADATFNTGRGFGTRPNGSLIVLPPQTAHVEQSMHTVKLGLNYKLGADPSAQWRAPPAAVAVSGWTLEAATRYWLSSGRFQKDLPAFRNSTTSLISRLTFEDLTAHSGEIFARLDTPAKIFVKGFAGLGRIGGGKLRDEDWGLFPTGAPFTTYSNTVSNLGDTKLNYLAIDAGYDVLNAADFRLGGFIGYTKIYEQYTATDCRQVASPSSGICSPPITGVTVLTETDKWSAWRLGLAAGFRLTPQLKLSADAAWLPDVKFTGRDNHWLRFLVIDESGRGQGMQLETMLSYDVTPAFSVGLGGRYWAIWTNTGSDAFNGRPIRRPDTYRYERLGLLVQAAYQFR